MHLRQFIGLLLAPVSFFTVRKTPRMLPPRESASSSSAIRCAYSSRSRVQAAFVSRRISLSARASSSLRGANRRPRATRFFATKCSVFSEIQHFFGACAVAPPGAYFSAAASSAPLRPPQALSTVEHSADSNASRTSIATFSITSLARNAVRSTFGTSRPLRRCAARRHLTFATTTRWSNLPQPPPRWKSGYALTSSSIDLCRSPIRTWSICVLSPWLPYQVTRRDSLCGKYVAPTHKSWSSHTPARRLPLSLLSAWCTCSPTHLTLPTRSLPSCAFMSPNTMRTSCLGTDASRPRSSA